MDEEKKQRIGKIMAAALIGTALFIDLFEALLNVVGIGEALSTVISVASDTLFMIWFWMLGIGFVKSPKKLAAMSIQAIMGFIPVINTLPELTIGIMAIVFLTRAEDKGGIVGTLAGSTLSIGKRKVNTKSRIFRPAGPTPTISREEIIEESSRRDPRFSAEQYERALGATRRVFTNNRFIKNSLDTNETNNK